MASPAAAISVEKQIDKAIEKQKPLIEMYNQILNAPQPLLSESFSFEYGGAWIDEDYLHINIVGNMENAVDFYTRVCTYPDKLKFYSVVYTHEELCNLATLISKLEHQNVVFVAVDEIYNCISIGIDNTIIEKN